MITSRARWLTWGLPVNEKKHLHLWGGVRLGKFGARDTWPVSFPMAEHHCALKGLHNCTWQPQPNPSQTEPQETHVSKFI